MPKIISIGLICLISFIGLIKPNSVKAITIIDGDLIRATNTFDVYIVKLIPAGAGQVAKKFKRLILNPEIFNQYGHLKWENIKDVSQDTINQYTVSDLVRAVGDQKVYKLYPNGDVGNKRWIKTADDFLGLGYDWFAIYEINNFERDSYTSGEDLTYSPPVNPPAPPSRTQNITINVPNDYSTIGAAINASIDGDTILIKAGTYNENIVINKGLKLIGEAVSSTIINGGGSGNAITISSGKDVLIQKFTIKSQDKYGIYCESEDLTTATFKINIIEGSAWGIGAEKNCELTILNNLIYNNKNSANTDGAGILIKNSYSYNITSEIRNNTIDDNYHGIWSENANLKALNNIITSNIGGRGVMVSTGIYHSGNGELNNIYSDTWGNASDFGGDAVPGDGSLIVDPKFVGTGQRNYRLKYGATDYSPCLDAGYPDLIYKDGTRSSNTDRNDMGAYGGPDNLYW